MVFVAPLLVFLLQAVFTYQTTVIKVTNGGQLGTWGEWETCPPGHIARAFQTKTEPWQGPFRDDTAMNGIALHCAKPGSRNISKIITSSVGRWGNWGPVLWCPTGFIVRYKLKVEPYYTLNDNTAANKIHFLCSDFTFLEQGLDWGWYGEWSDTCFKGISGIRSRVQGFQGLYRDDSALNDAQLMCSEN
ncbi:vitelline membrane outer layer protein 1 homolog [Gastrophryne carolinensis]